MIIIMSTNEDNILHDHHQGYINRCILLSGIRARRVSCEHVENMELRCALVLRAPCSVSQSTVLGVSEHRALCLRALCSVSQSTVLWFLEHCAQCLRAPWSVSQSTVLSVSEHRALCLRALCSLSQSTMVCVSEHPM